VNTRLIQVVPFTDVPASATVGVQHSINVNGTRKRPDFVAGDASGFTIVVSESIVSVTNNNAAPASINVWLELKHTAERELGNAIDDMTPQPFVVASPAAAGPAPTGTGQRFVYTANGTETPAGFVVNLPQPQTQPYLVWAQMEGYPGYGPYMTFDIPTATMTPTQFTVLPSDNLVAGDQIAFYVDEATAPPVEITYFINGAIQIPPKYNDPSFQVSVLGGDMVQVTGNDFTGTTNVTVNGVSVPFVVNNNNLMTLGPLPSGQPYGPATVIATKPGSATPPATPFIYSHWRTLAPVGVPASSLLRNDGWSLLLDNGKVLYFGGSGINGQAGPNPPECFLFDPATLTWAPTGSLNLARECFAAVKHSNGKVYVFGGTTVAGDAPFGNPAQTTEIYDPVTGTWSMGGNIQPRGLYGGFFPRLSFCAFELPDGNILIYGGNNTNQSEIYNVTTNLSGSYATIPTFGNDGQVYDCTGVQLANGDIIAWLGGDCLSAVNGVTLRYDYATNTWSMKTPMPTPRSGNDMRCALLPSGKIITVGGATASFNLNPGNRPATNVVEIYDPVNDTWAAANPIADQATGVQLSVLADGTLQRSGGAMFTFPYVYAALTTEHYDESTGLWTPRDPRQMTNTPGWWFWTNVPGWTPRITGGGAWDHKMVIVMPGTDVIFVVGQYPYGDGVEQYRPLPL
jgi:hypothetical protein